MYDVSLRRIRTLADFEGFDGAYFTAGNHRYYHLTEFNLQLAISLGLLNDMEAAWAWEDLIQQQQWESVRQIGQLTWMLQHRRPSHICVIKGENAAEHGRVLRNAGYHFRASNQRFERWILQSQAL